MGHRCYHFCDWCRNEMREENLQPVKMIIYTSLRGHYHAVWYLCQMCATGFDAERRRKVLDTPRSQSA